MNTGLKLAISNLRYVLMSSDILAMRFALAVGSLCWAGWVAISGYTYFNSASVELPLTHTQVMLWAILFLFHGLSDIAAILLHCYCKGFAIIRSMLGAVLWTVSVAIIVVIRVNENTLPMGGAHWLAAFIAWWIFLRAVFKDEQYD